MSEQLKEVYEKYKHLDELLSDEIFLGGNIQGVILYELWQTIKEEVKDAKV